MYCNRCGGALNAGDPVCPACGERVLPGPSLAQPPRAVAPTITIPSDRVRRHIPVLAALWAINGILRLVEVLAFLALGHLPGIFGFRYGALDFPFHWTTWPLTIGLAWLVVGAGIFGVIHLILAFGLHERKVWGRPLALVIGFLSLLRFPLGTALGAYTIWVFLPEPSRREFDQIAVH